jgi:DNA-directed RNA polymerase subunit M
MEFCPKCGAVLMSKLKNSACPRCNYTQKGTVELKSSEKIEAAEEIAIVKKEISTYPVVNEECKKCGHKKAFYWIQQMRGSDEAPSKFFKCCKCSIVRREDR